MSTKPFLPISAEPVFYLLLGFLFFIPLSIAVCSILQGVFALLLLWHLIRRRSWPRLPLFFYLFLVYALFTLVSSAFSPTPASSFRDNRELLIFFLVPLYMLVVTDRRRLGLSLWTVCLSAVVSAAFGVFSAVRQGITLGARLKGFTSHWMTFAGLLSMVLVFFIVYLAMQRRGWRDPRALALPLLAVAVFFSLTRSAWVGVIVALGLFLLWYRPRWAALALPAAVVLVLLLPRPVQQRIRSIVDPRDSTNRDRVYMMVTGWRMFLDRPLVGVGTNNVERFYDMYRHPDAVNHNMHLHNNFMQALAERGIFAFLALVAAFIVMVAGIIGRLRRANAGLRPLFAASLFVAVMFLVSGMFEYNFGDSEIKFLLLFFVTLPFLPICEETHHDEVETGG